MKTFPAFDARIGSVTDHIVDPNVEAFDQVTSRFHDIRPDTAEGYVRAGETLGRLLKRFSSLDFRFGRYRPAKTA